ncbi:MAG: Fpg/Nei family DNA glycosylase [Bacillota bacterium]
MAELPELVILARQMHEALAGRTIVLVEANRPECLNVPPEVLRQVLPGRTIVAVTRRGKWLFLNLEPPGHLLLNLGMGADLWYYRPGEELPAKYQFRLELDDGAGFTCRFWWFGYIRFLKPEELPGHKETAGLGPSPLEIAPEEFAALVAGAPRATVKSFLLDQKKISGIGNAYAHDILWHAGLHPLRKLGTLTPAEIERLYFSMRYILERGIALGGVERDFYRTGGNMNDWASFMLIGYKADQPCPRCGTAITVIKTGATKSFLCPRCQPGL